MPMRRNQKQHSEGPTLRQRKINSLLQKRVAEVIKQRDLAGIAGILTITAVTVTSDLREAKVWFSVLGQDPKQVLQVLESNLHDIQTGVYQALSMRPVPKISFFVDTSEIFSSHINQVIQSLHHE